MTRDDLEEAITNLHFASKLLMAKQVSSADQKSFGNSRLSILPGFVESGTAATTVFQTDEPLYEIVRGDRLELPPTSVLASLIAGRLFNALDSFLAGNELGTAVETLMILDPQSNLRRRPDVAFVDSDRWPLEREVPLT